MGHLEFNVVSLALPDGRPLLADVSFRVGAGDVTALVGPNGTGKTTLLRMAAGTASPDEGTAVCSGSLAVMPQFIGSVRDYVDGAGSAAGGVAGAGASGRGGRRRRGAAR